jgi:glucose-6-phosphate isomerase
MINGALNSELDMLAGALRGVPATHRYLGDLRGSFADGPAYEQALRNGNPLLYSVSSVSAGEGPGQLHYAMGTLMPGRIGREYYLTKGHFHARREAAEVYIGFRGEGLMLLEDEQGDSRLVPLRINSIVYVPGNTAHRTINTGGEPLVYLGVYPADAGHDYGAIAKKNFRQVVLEQNGKPLLIERADYKP